MLRLRRLTARASLLGVLLTACATTHEVAPDGGGSCRWQAPPVIGFSCESYCDDWAEGLASHGLAIARCASLHGDAHVLPSDRYRCANADRCDGDVCYCGSFSECADGSACMRVGDSSYCIACDR
ncbi:MAG: hypothetical protein U0234_21250 [Sandaracinus sp.]